MEFVMAVFRSPSLVPPLAALALALLPLTHAHAQTQLIQNGGFETGTLAHWSIANQSGSAGTFQIGDHNFTNIYGFASPIEQYSNAGAASGRYYAVTDSLIAGNDDKGTMLLYQNINLSGFTSFSSAILNFDMVVQDYVGAGLKNKFGTLDYTQTPISQFVRVDLLRKNALTGDVFTLASGDVLQNLYLDGTDTSSGSYLNYNFDITALLNQQKLLGNDEVSLRFAVVSGNIGGYHAQVDNVSLIGHSPMSVTPEAPGLVQLLPGLLPLGFVALKRRRATKN